MSKVLCVNSYEDLSALVRGEVDTIQAEFSDFNSKEEGSTLHSLNAHISLFAVDVEEGKLSTLQFTPEGDKGHSVGFGGLIVEGTVVEHSGVDENGVYTVSIEDLIKTSEKLFLASVTAETGLDESNPIYAKLVNSLSVDNTAVFRPDGSEEVTMLGGVCLTSEELITVRELKGKVEVSEGVEDFAVGILGINYGKLIETMNIDNAIVHMCKELFEEAGLCGESVVMVRYLTFGAVSSSVPRVSYRAMVEVARQLTLNEQAEEALKGDNSIKIESATEEETDLSS